VLSKFVKSGKLQVEKSCTQTLQSFKKPSRLHRGGGAVRAEDLGPGVKNDNDPRPERFRNMAGYTDHVFSATVNYAYESGVRVNVSWRYAFPKADLQSAVQDHDYLEKPYVQY
jgi:hypothetical protein